MILQGRPFSFVPSNVLNNHRREISPTKRVASVELSSRIGRYLEEPLDAYWSTVTKFVVGFQR